MKTFLRWLVLVPAAVLGSSIIKLVFEWFLKLSISSSFMCDPDALYLRMIALFSGNVVNGTAIVFIAYYLAPKHNTKVAFVFAVINVIAAFIMILFNFYYHLSYMFANLFFYCVNAASSIMAIISIHNDPYLNYKAPE